MRDLEGKLQQIFSLITDEDKEKLRIELSKMVPSESSVVKARVFTETHSDRVQNVLHFVLEAFTEDESNESAYNLLQNLIKKSKVELGNVIKGFDFVLDQKPLRIELGDSPALEIAENTMAYMIFFKVMSQNEQVA